MAGFLKGYPHYADAALLSPTLPSNILTLPCCATLDKDSWIFILPLQNSDLPGCRRRARKRGVEGVGGVWLVMVFCEFKF